MQPSRRRVIPHPEAQRPSSTRPATPMAQSPAAQAAPPVIMLGAARDQNARRQAVMSHLRQAGSLAGAQRLSVQRPSADASTAVPLTSPAARPEPARPAISLGNKAAQDPRFRQVMVKIERTSARMRSHPSAAQKAAESQAAARPPVNEKLAGAQAQQMDTMGEAEAGKPDTDSFLLLLRAEIDKAMPQTLGDTEKFMQGENKQQLKGAMTANVRQQKEQAASGIKSASERAPDPSGIVGKSVSPLPPQAVPTPDSVGAADAIPLPKPDVQVSLQKSKQDANKALADAKVTPEQLRKANDPRFSDVLTAKSSVERQANAAPSAIPR